MNIDEVTNLTAIAYDRLPNDVEGDRKGVEMYLRFESFKKESGQNFSAWLHRMASRFNAPATPAVAEARFRAHCEELIRHACSTDMPEALRQSPKKFRIDGNSAFAQAFKKLSAAMILGADLKDGDFDTVNKCGKWAKEESERVGKEKAEAEIKEFLKSQGVEDTPEERRKFGLISSEKPTDPISLALAGLEKELREHAKVAPEGQSVEMVDSLTKHVAESTAKLIAAASALTIEKATGTSGKPGYLS